MQFLADLFLHLYEEYDINFIVFFDQWEFDRYVKAIGLTLKLSVLCIMFSLLIGVAGAWLQRSRVAPVRWLVYAYVQVFRNTPPLAQLYFFYFGLGTIMPRFRNEMGLMEPFLGNFEWAVLALSLFAGAFNVEIFRSGVEAVPKTTVEAASALGYSRLKAYIYVIFPLAFRISLPGLINNIVNLLKTTSIAYAIGVAEVLYVAQQVWAVEFNVPEMMTLVLVTYLAIVSIFVWLMSRLRRHMRIPGYDM